MQSMYNVSSPKLQPGGRGGGGTGGGQGGYRNYGGDPQIQMLMEGKFLPSKGRELRRGRSKVPRTKTWNKLGRVLMRDDPTKPIRSIFDNMEDWFTQAALNPDPNTWTIPGYTKQCDIAAVNCNTTTFRGDGWWGPDVQHWFYGCNNLAYGCNNWGAPYATLDDLQTAWPILRGIAYGMDQGPFVQWLRHIWTNDAYPAPTPAVVHRPLVYAPQAVPWSWADPDPLGVRAPWPRVEPLYEPYRRPYEVPAVEIRVNADAPRHRPPVSPPTEVLHRQVPDKSRKVQMPGWLFKLLKLYHGATEVMDAVECMHKALPPTAKGHLPGPSVEYGKITRTGAQKMADVFSNLDEVDWAKALPCMAINEVIDRAVAKTIGTLGEAGVTDYGTVSTTQTTGLFKFLMLNK